MHTSRDGGEIMTNTQRDIPISAIRHYLEREFSAYSGHVNDSELPQWQHDRFKAKREAAGDMLRWLSEYEQEQDRSAS